MKPSKYEWDLLQTEDCSDELISALKELKLPEEIGPLLLDRGIETPEKLDKFLHPDFHTLHDPYLLYDMERVVKRIYRSVENQERILIYGDYDADGITSTVVMKEAIELLGGEVSYYLPNRFTDGYGPNVQAFSRAIESGIQLIITVDNGVAGHEALQFAKEKGVDVIVTDHHELPNTLPEAYAIIHPRHPKGNYPFGDLAGVGVAFKVATALLEEIPGDFLDLVAIGTVADLVSLTDENRALVKLGLDGIHQSQRIGLQKLFNITKNPLENCSEETIGFSIAPRLNAIGRLGDASNGVELLTTFDEEAALKLAVFVQEKNEERQEIVEKMFAEALSLLESLPTRQVNVLAKEGWHEGVLGIVASRLVKETGKPTLIFTIDAEKKMAKGSGRSVAALDLYEALNVRRELFLNFGGHHMAAGMTLSSENLEELAEYLDEYILAKKIDLTKGNEIKISRELKIPQITIPFIEAIRQMAPFGTDNMTPVFLIKGAEVREPKQIGGNQKHLKFQMVAKAAQLDCVAFNCGSDHGELLGENEVEVVGRLSVNEWNGSKKPQVLVSDFKVTGFQLFDIRGNHQKDFLFHAKGTLFVVFQKQHLSLLKKFSEIESCLMSTIDEIPSDKKQSIRQLVLVDCPENLEDIKFLLQKIPVDRLYLWCASPEECYLSGMPSHKQFSELFLFIKKHRKVDVRYKYREISRFLKVSDQIFIFMAHVFEDLDFVQIQDGVMDLSDDLEKKALETSRVYQQRLQQIEVEKFLLYSDIPALKQWMIQ